MKKILIALFMIIAMSAPAHAYGCDDISTPRGTPDNVIIELKKKCLELEPSVSTPVTVNNMAEYAELGQKYGIAISEVAKSIGTTANELAQTPVGKFMLIMVAYKVMGNDLIGIAGGFVWFTIMIPLWTYLLHRIVLSTRKIEEKFSEAGKRLSTVKSPVDWNGPAGPLFFVMCVFFLFICISGFLMVFA